MDRYIEIVEHKEESFKPLIFFESWRVAVLNYADIVSKEGFYRMERHPETDEVFVLLAGKAFLIAGDDRSRIPETRVIEMEPLKLYNIKKNVWHHIVMSRDCSVLIVENADTAVENSEYQELDKTQIDTVLAQVRL